MGIVRGIVDLWWGNALWLSRVWSLCQEMAGVEVSIVLFDRLLFNSAVDLLRVVGLLVAHLAESIVLVLMLGS